MATKAMRSIFTDIRLELCMTHSTQTDFIVHHQSLLAAEKEPLQKLQRTNTEQSLIQDPPCLQNFLQNFQNLKLSQLTIRK